MGHQIDYPLLYYYIFWIFLDVVQISEKKRLQCVKNVNRVIMCEAFQPIITLKCKKKHRRMPFSWGQCQ